MLRQLLISAILILGLGGPLAAQQSEEGTAMSAAQCLAMFNDADINGDGVLSQQEIAAADLGDTSAGISRSEFISECEGP